MNNNNLKYIQKVIFSENLQEKRTINIYNPDETQKQPTLYLLDGGITEQFVFVTEMIQQLINAKFINPVIVVGIANTDRNYDLTNTTVVEKDKKWVPRFGNSAHFSDFISEELIPFIDENFQTSRRTILMGESLAGLFAMEILLNKPTLFSNYIIIDPSLWWNNHSLMQSYIAKFDFEILKDKKLWIASSKTVSIKILVQEWIQILVDKNIPTNNWQYLHDENQTHFTIFKSSIEKALIWHFGRP